MRLALLIISLLLVTFTATAQTNTPTPTPYVVNNPNADCGNGLPCGQIPWSMPSYPQISSPTPINWWDRGDAVISPGLETNTPTPTPTATLDIVDEATQVIEYIEFLDLTGTPYEFEVTQQAEYDVLIANSDTFFSYVKAISIADFGILTPLVTGFFVLVTLTMLLKLSTLLIPILGIFAGIIRKIIELIPGF